MGFGRFCCPKSSARGRITERYVSPEVRERRSVSDHAGVSGAEGNDAHPPPRKVMLTRICPLPKRDSRL